MLEGRGSVGSSLDGLKLRFAALFRRLTGGFRLGGVFLIMVHEYLAGGRVKSSHKVAGYNEAEERVWLFVEGEEFFSRVCRDERRTGTGREEGNGQGRERKEGTD